MHEPSASGPANAVTPAPRDIAEVFAAALDAGDLARVSHLLAPECECHDSELRTSGAAAVVALYRVAASWAERGFDDVRHVGAVASQSGGRVRVEVTSMFMRMPGRWHRLRHTRELAVDGGGRIVAIVHFCEPASAVAFRAFVRGCEVSPPPAGFGL